MKLAGLAVAALLACAPETAPPSAAPDFRLESLDGRTIRLSDLRGRVVLLYFWATWCGPCKVETPWLVDLDRRRRAAGLEIVGVAMDEADAVAGFVRDRGVTYTVVIGNDAVAAAYGGVRLLPHMALIGRGGELLTSAPGLRTRSELDVAVARALAAR